MLEDKIYQDYVTALKAKDKAKTEFLSFIRADLKNQAIELRKDKLADDEALAVLKKQQKRLQDSKESFAASGRIELIQNLEKELTLLAEYLPTPLADEELAKIVKDTISKLGASSMKDMGNVMKEVLAKAGARADSKKVSNLVKENLCSNK